MTTTVKATSTRRQSSLRNWKAYKQFYKSLPKGNLIERKDKALNRFEARYNLASRFQGINADGISKKTLKGYEVGFRLMLAYTTAELLFAAIGGNVNKLSIEDAGLASKLRTMLKRYEKSNDPDVPAIKDISKVIKSSNSINQFNLFMHNKNRTNVRIIATVLRIAMAHGPYSPYAFDIHSAADAATINQLSKRLLMKCQQEFNEWFAKQKATYKH